MNSSIFCINSFEFNYIPLSLKIDTTRKIAKIALITNPKTPKYGNLIINIPLSVVMIMDEPIKRAESINATDNLLVILSRPSCSTFIRISPSSNF